MAKLFIDIETIADKNIDPKIYETFFKKNSQEWESIELSDEDFFVKRAWLYAEYGRIVCISIGKIENDWSISLKSFMNEDERNLLLDFVNFIWEWNHTRVGHNIKSFDLPFIVKRMRVTWTIVPYSLRFTGKKPREVDVIDTMEIWRWLGDWKSNTSLDLICKVLWIDTPKDNGDGSMVYQWRTEEKFDTIKTYCEWDVKATIDVFQKIY